MIYYTEAIAGRFYRRSRAGLHLLDTLDDRVKLALCALRFDRAFAVPMYYSLLTECPIFVDERIYRIQQILDLIIQEYWSGDLDAVVCESLASELALFNEDEDLITTIPGPHMSLLSSFMHIFLGESTELTNSSMFVMDSALRCLWSEASRTVRSSHRDNSVQLLDVDGFVDPVPLDDWLSVHNPAGELLDQWILQDQELVVDPYRMRSLMGARGRMLAWEQSRLFAQTLYWMLGVSNGLNGNPDSWWNDVERKLSIWPDPIEWIIP